MIHRDLLLLDLAETLAEVKHYDQVRRGTGEPYVHHVVRVASRVSNLGERAQTVALLHDLVEDTDVTYSLLEQLGFSADVIHDVWALSRLSDESYADFIDRTTQSGSVDALQVKLADIHDNMNDQLYDGRPPARYIRADRLIREELLRRGEEPLTWS